MFQWTAGQKGNAGELPALLKIIKTKFASVYNKYFGRYGLDVSSDTKKTTGHFVLHSTTINTPELKEELRDPVWAYRFAKAGYNSRVCSVQLLHAINRFERFYFHNTSKLGGNSLISLMSSEYAASLLLDNHVNRPGYVYSCVATAIQQLGMSYAQVVGGNDATERKVIDQYIKVRATYGKYPMTDANTRARVTQKYLNSSRISAARGSFRSNRAQRQG